MRIISIIKYIFKNTKYYINHTFVPNFYCLIGNHYNKFTFISKTIKLFLPGLINFYEIYSKDDLKFQKFLLFRGSISTESPPNSLKENLCSNSFGPINANYIKNIKFKINSSCFIQGKDFYIDSLVFNNPLKYGFGYFGFIKLYPFIDYLFNSKTLRYRSLILINNDLWSSKIINIENGIFIGGDGSENWYHWVIEYLPKLFISEKLPDQFKKFPLIVPDICRKNKNFYDSLVIFNKLNRKILFFSVNEIILAKNLIYIDNVCSAPFQLLKNSRPSSKDYKQHDALLLKYSSKFTEFRMSNLLNQKMKITYKKIFLARKDSNRAYNQDEILRISRKYGFKEVYLERLSLQEQIILFGTADYIIGPSGAAWTGMIFAKENKLKCLTWMPDYLKEACTFSNLASLLGHELNYIIFENKESKKDYNFHYHSYNLNINLFEDKLTELICD